MARVPMVQSRNVQRSGLTPTNIEPTRNVGAQVLNQTLEQTGTKVMSLAEEWDQIEAQRDEAWALERDNELARTHRDALFTGPNAFANRRGLAAGPEAINSTREDLTAAQASMFEDAPSPRARAMLQRVAERRMESSLTEMAKHSRSEVTAARDSGRDARVVNLESDFAAAGPNPQAQAPFRTALENEYRQRAEERGLPEEVARVDLDRALTRVHTTIATQVATSDPLAGLRYIREHSAEILDPEENRLAAGLRAPILEAVATKYEEDWAAGRTPADHYAEVRALYGEEAEDGATNAAPPTANQPSPTASPEAQTTAAASGGINPGGQAGRMAVAIRGGTVAGRRVPEHVIAGVLGNVEVESGFNPGPSGDGGSARGHMQWRDQRVANFRRIIGADPSSATPEQAARFFLWEMNNPGAAGMTVAQRNAILSAPTAGQAAALIDRYYERSSGAHRDRRVRAAERFQSGVEGPAETLPQAGREGPDLGASLSWARGLNVPPELREMIGRRIQARVGLEQQIITQRRAEQQSEAERWLLQHGGSEGLTDPTKIPGFNELDPTVQLHYRDLATDNVRRAQTEARERANRPAQDTDWSYYDQLHNMSMEQLRAIPLPQLRARIAPSELNEILTRRSGSSAEVLQQDTVRNAISPILDASGLTLDNRGNWAINQARGYTRNQVTTFVQMEAQQHRIRTGQNPTSDDLQHMAARAMTRVWRQGQPNSERYMYQLPPEARSDQSLRFRIPVTERARIIRDYRAVLRANGVAERDPSEAQIAEMFLSGGRLDPR